MSSESDSSYRPSPSVLARRAMAKRQATLLRRRIVAASVAAVVFVLLLVALISAIAGGGGHAASAASAQGLTALATGGPAPQGRPLEADENRAVDKVLSYTPFVSRGGTRGREIALTFDDGPGPYTMRVVKVLRRYHAPATFFQVGQMIPVFHAAGNDVRRHYPIGDHTVSHPQLGRLPIARQRDEIIGDVPRLRLENVPTPRLFRPPYASYNKDTLSVLKTVRMLMVLWSIDSRDYTRPGANVIVGNVLSNAKPGAIVLMHDAGGDRSQDVAALPAIIHKLRKRHFKLVTVPQMLIDAPPPRNQPLPPNAGVG
jgi:peptidoglycan/xylan/chitin deacetylase (PgdA/CDA1 family)